MRFSQIKWYSFLLVTKTHGNSLVIYRNTTLRDNTDIITNRQLIHGKISLIFLWGHIQIWHHKCKFFRFMTQVNSNNENETESDIFPWDIFKSDTFFYQNILKYFNDFQNQNFSVLWLKWTQIMEMKQNQTFFHGTYSNLTNFLAKHIKVFQWLSKSNFLSFMMKVNPNKGN